MPTSASPSRARRLGPGLLIALVIGLWLAIAGAGGPAIGKLSSVSSNDQSTFLPQSADSVKAQEKLRELDDSGAIPAFVILLGDAVYDAAFPSPAESPAGPPTGPPGAAYASAFAEGITVDGQRLDSLLAPGQTPLALPAKDSSGVMVLLPLDATKMAQQDADGESLLKLTVAEIRAQAPEVTGANTVHLTGPAGFSADIGAAFGGIDGLLLIVTLSVVLLILLVVYRSLVLPLLVLFSSVTALAGAGLIVYQLAKNGTIVVNGQSQGILSILVIGAATDYSLLLVSRYREELRRHERPLDAMKVAWRACLEPIAASAGTVTLGLLCLLLSDLNSNRGLGPVGAIGIVASLLVALTLLPALLLLGRWVFWPRVPHVGETRTSGVGIWERTAAFVQRRARPIWIVVALVLIAFCAAIPSFKANGTSQADVFLAEVDSVTGQQVLDSRFEAGAADPLRVVVDAQDATAFADALTGRDGVASVTVGEKQTAGGEVEVQVVPVDPGQAEDLVGDVRDVASQVAPEALVGGNAAIALDTRETAQHDLRIIIPAILIVVLAVLIMLLRSIVAPLMLIVATVVSFGASLGVAALVFNNIFDFPGADPAVPLLGFVFLVALGVDYSIFLMTRAREEVAVLGPRDGVSRAVAVTGSVITSAGVVLAATFAALAVLPILFLAQLAFIVAFGVLLDTLIVRTLLVPAMAIDAGRITWWPSKLATHSAD